MEKDPIISKIIKESDEVGDEMISDFGVVSMGGKEMGVRRKVFEGADGKKYYVYKEVTDVRDAEDTMDIYTTFKRLGLPVVDFAKIIKKRVRGNDEFVIAMEDLTEDGKYDIVEVTPILLREWIIQKGLFVPQEIKIAMIEALAKIHNERIFHYHPDSSFALRIRKIEGKDDFEVIDFRIIDYANFKREGVPGIPLPDVKAPEGVFKEEQVEDLRNLLLNITIDTHEREFLRRIYAKERTKK